jgi:hypothetical protein
MILRKVQFKLWSIKLKLLEEQLKKIVSKFSQNILCHHPSKKYIFKY